MTFPGAYALMARSYFDQYGGSREDLAQIAVKNHEHALDNAHAQFRKEVDGRGRYRRPDVAPRSASTTPVRLLTGPRPLS